jgi:hypothetical protein
MNGKDLACSEEDGKGKREAFDCGEMTNIPENHQ